MQLSCPGLSLVMTAEFTVITLGQSYHPSNGKVQTYRDPKKAGHGEKESHNFL
jgi:hypothetical protein